jgi:hypothetical protein
MLVQQKGVQQELKMTDAQVKQVKEVPQKLRDLFQAEGQKLKRDPEWTKKRQELMKERVMAELHKALAGILRPEQMERLRQISRQENGPLAFSDPEVDKALKLTEAQKAKIKALNEGYLTQMFKILDISEGGLKTDTSLSQVRKEGVSKITALLTDEQKKAYQGLVGEPFEVKKDRRMTREQGGGSLPAATPRRLTPSNKEDLSWVEKRLEELEPAKEERRIDAIGWVKGLREAVRLSKEHDRPIFLFTYDGNVRTGRC